MIQNEIEKVIGNKYGNSYETKLKLLEVLFLAEELLKKYNVETTEIVLRDHYGAKGKCNNECKISLQINFIIKEDISIVKNTVLHEIAHVLAGVVNGHNEIWQNIAKEMGVTFNKNYKK